MPCKYMICIIAIHICTAVNAQKMDDDSLINEIKSSVTAFFIKNHALTQDDVKASPNAVYVTEILDRKVIGYDTNGIYRIGVFKSHSESHILIKDGSRFKIFDIEQISEALKEVISYTERHKLNADSLFAYLKQIMEMYDYNYKFVPHSAGKMHSDAMLNTPSSRLLTVP